MSSEKIISVNDTYFQHKVLTKIHGQPVYENLKLLETEIKANASSVPSTIGGDHGHLGLILSPTRYATLANTVPWITPVNPGPFVPPANGTAAQIEAAKDVWRESKYDFSICQATEKAIVAQIVEAIDKNYIRTLLNRTTGQYSTDIRAVLRHLFTTYGKITPQHVKEVELATYNMAYDISQPVDNVFDAIEDLVDLAEHGNSPMTPQQMIDIAYIIFAKQPILKQDLREWNRKPLIDRTWTNMVTHLRDAQSDLNAFPVAADIYNQQPHQANAVAAMADMVAQRLIDAMPNLPYEEAPVQPPEQAPVIAPLPDTVNTAIQQREAALTAREAALDARMEAMMNLMRTNTGGAGTAPPTNDGNWRRVNHRTNGGRGGRGTNQQSTGTSTRRTRLPRQYCWSHGCCAHNGHGCEDREPGHKVEATFENMMGGSTKNCYWLTRN